MRQCGFAVPGRVQHEGLSDANGTWDVQLSRYDGVLQHSRRRDKGGVACGSDQLRASAYVTSGYV